jgi:hypothetical protein
VASGVGAGVEARGGIQLPGATDPRGALEGGDEEARGDELVEVEADRRDMQAEELGELGGAATHRLAGGGPVGDDVEVVEDAPADVRGEDREVLGAHGWPGLLDLEDSGCVTYQSTLRLAWGPAQGEYLARSGV